MVMQSMFLILIIIACLILIIKESEVKTSLSREFRPEGSMEKHQSNIDQRCM